MGSDDQYELLPTDADLDDKANYTLSGNGGLDLQEALTRLRATTRRRVLVFGVVVVLQAVLNAVLLVIVVAGYKYYLTAPQGSSGGLYSPARDAVRSVQKVFIPDFTSSTTYIREPSPEVDQAWKDLYEHYLVARISKAEAALIPNKTLPIPGDTDHYAVGLAVFHHLHCLDQIRMALNPAHYYVDPATGVVGMSKNMTDHVNHCVDSLRQAAMCASDISLIVWQWHAEQGRALAHMGVSHECRDFDAILDWQKQHMTLNGFDPFVHAVNT